MNDKTKKRGLFGPDRKRYKPKPRLSLKEQQRKIAAYMEFIKPDGKK